MSFSWVVRLPIADCVHCMEAHLHPRPMSLALVLSSSRKESKILSGRVIRCSVNFNKSTMSFMSPGMKSQSAYFFARVAFYGFVCMCMCVCGVAIVVAVWWLHSIDDALVMRCICGVVSNWFKCTAHTTWMPKVNGNASSLSLWIYQMESITARNITLFAILCILVGALSCTPCTFLPFVAARFLSFTLCL